MANFLPTNAGASSRDLYVHCTKDSCSSKPPLVKYIDKHVITKPNPQDKVCRLEKTHRTWYCCHCNNVIAASEIRPETDVVGLPKVGG